MTNCLWTNHSFPGAGTNPCDIRSEHAWAGKNPKTQEDNDQLPHVWGGLVSEGFIWINGEANIRDPAKSNYNSIYTLVCPAKLKLNSGPAEVAMAVCPVSGFFFSFKRKENSFLCCANSSPSNWLWLPLPPPHIRTSFPSDFVSWLRLCALYTVRL